MQDNLYSTKEGEYEHKDLLSLLNSNSIVEKHFAILELNTINSIEEAKILVSNLTGQDGKIREAVAHKVDEFTQNPSLIGYFIDDSIFETLLQGIMDINGNVCRLIVNCELNKTQEYKKFLSQKLPESIRKIINGIDESNAELKPFHQKRYVVSKRNFQLYWCMGALYNCVEDIEFKSLKDILFWCGEFYDYTIREKTAKILTKIDSPELSELKEKLKNDENYYVRRFLAKENI